VFATFHFEVIDFSIWNSIFRDCLFPLSVN
jgi:hypothetical protein